MNTKLTPEVLLDRWQHATAVRNYPLKTWNGVLIAWAKWMRTLLDSPNKKRLPAELRPYVESELAWCLADLQYLNTLTYAEPTDVLAPPSYALSARTGVPHPFIHLLLGKRHRDRVGGITGGSSTDGRVQQDGSRQDVGRADVENYKDTAELAHSRNKTSPTPASKTRVSKQTGATE